MPETNTHKSATVGKLNENNNNEFILKSIAFYILVNFTGKEPLAFVIPIVNTTDRFIISYGSTIAIITWDGESSRVSRLAQIAYIDSTKSVYRANEGKVAPSGSLFIGTHSAFLPNGTCCEKNTAALYAFDKSGASKIVLDGVTVSNGMQWSADNKKFYYIDSLAYTVESFSYDINTDMLSKKLKFNLNNIFIDVRM